MKGETSVFLTYDISSCVRLYLTVLTHLLHKVEDKEKKSYESTSVWCQGHQFTLTSFKNATFLCTNGEDIES